jgi:tetratricopeptide (TPR) repeat protein
MLRFHQDRRQPEDVASCHSCSLKNLAPALAVGFVVVLFLQACDLMTTKRDAQLIKDADAKSSEGNFLQAIDLYEKALDGSSRSADIHYRLALLYDDKLNDPLHALHHFKRYLTLAPNGPATPTAPTRSTGSPPRRRQHLRCAPPFRVPESRRQPSQQRCHSEVTQLGISSGWNLVEARWFSTHFRSRSEG